MRHSMRKRTGARNLSPNSCLPCWRPSSRATETSFAAARPEDERDGDPGSIRQARRGQAPRRARSEEHTSELQSLMRISYAVFCLKKKTNKNDNEEKQNQTKTQRQSSEH